MTTSNGLLLVDKPRGLTSHDVVARVRRILHEKKVGHAGTLDPMATGLLVLGVGPSTRLLRFAQAETKRYVGVVMFGVATDSLDADGTTVEEREVPSLSKDAVEAATQSMIGPQLQTPPMVSAIKIDGQRLHELARRGVEVERRSREITVSAFTLSPTDDPSLWRFEVECSVGTYVRVLLSDLAFRLGTIGHLVELRRTASGSHVVDDALTLDAFAEMVEQGRDVVASPATFVTELPHVIFDDDKIRAVRMGQRVTLTEEFRDDEIAAMDASGELVAILQRRGESWKPALVLATADESARG
ncbi:MAG TPA: tRNA pseudouridine(55) synthase TruB [Acidimicrobiales bacterium]|nr:tRNA pseudouridine(55) synthase TruB [Acidimicrobiales bacterium]